MGLDYEFQIVAPRDGLDALLRATTAVARPPERELLLAAARGVAAGQIRQLVEEKHHELGLCLLFAPDERLLRDDWARMPDGRVSVGYIYTRLWLGVRDAIVTYTAATTGMSRLFDESPSVRETFRSIGVAADATSVSLDRERGDLVQVWPRSVTTPGFSSYYAIADEPAGVDAYAAALREALAVE